MQCNSGIHSALGINRYYTGRFIMFSVITNIYNKKTKGPTFDAFVGLLFITSYS
jgi:hypothetical protein